jgi:hypothetical protein
MRSRIKQARDRIEPLRLALVNSTPEEFGAALPGLADAAFCLGAVEQELREGAAAPYEVRRELQLLKNELRIVARLIEHGTAFCRGWARILGASPAYTQNGRTAPEQCTGTLSLQG